MTLRTNVLPRLPFCCGVALWTALALALVQAAAHAQNRTGQGAAVLAVTWQPAFCETKPRKPECRRLDAGRYDADHFALHGLWPQKRGRGYCGDDRLVRQARRGGPWSRLPGIALDAELQRPLVRVMPGALSYLHRHEWWKHGTCYASDANSYYRDAIALMDALNRSEVRDLFAERVGEELPTRTIRAAFDAAFGRGAGRRVKVRCRRDGERQLIVELQIGLAGDIPARAARGQIGPLIRAARPVRADCPGGVVDPVGLQ